MVYYKNDEIVKVIRGNYSGRTGLREQFLRASYDLFNNIEVEKYWTEPLSFDGVRLYKRNRAGMPRKLMASVSVP